VNPAGAALTFWQISVREVRNPNAEPAKEIRNPKPEPGSAGTPAGVFSATNASQLAGRVPALLRYSKSRRLAFGFRISELGFALGFGGFAPAQEREVSRFPFGINEVAF